MRYIVASYGYMVGTNYLLVFILLVFMYWKILRWIHVLREQNRTFSTSLICFKERGLVQSLIITGARRSQAQYGAVDLLLLRSEAQARKRVIYFLTVFTITGLGSMCSLLLIDIGHV